MKEQAIVVHFNWITHEIKHTIFEGRGASDKAVGWCHRNSFVWKDFPTHEGWEHFYHANEFSKVERGKRLTDEFFETGSLVEYHIPN